MDAITVDTATFAVAAQADEREPHFREVERLASACPKALTAHALPEGARRAGDRRTACRRAQPANVEGYGRADRRDFRKGNKALGMLKKSLTCRSSALIRAVPSSRSTLTPP